MLGSSRTQPQYGRWHDELFCRQSSKHAFNAVEALGFFPCLCGASFVSMVKSTDLWNPHDPFRLVRLNYPTFWCVLIQGQVRAGFVIIAEIIFEQSTHMIVIEDDHMIDTLATNASVLL